METTGGCFNKLCLLWPCTDREQLVCLLGGITCYKQTFGENGFFRLDLEFLSFETYGNMDGKGQVHGGEG